MTTAVYKNSEDVYLQRYSNMCTNGYFFPISKFNETLLLFSTSFETNVTKKGEDERGRKNNYLQCKNLPQRGREKDGLVIFAI